MQEAVSALRMLLREPAVSSAALVAPDRSVLKAGLSTQDAVLAELGAHTRQLFRQAAPPLLHLDLQLARGRLLLLPLDEHVLMLVVDPGASLEPLLTAVDEQRERFVRAATATRSRTTATAGLRATATASASASPKAEAAPEGPLLLAEVGELLAFVRRTVRGPVLRHYMRAARVVCQARFPFLAKLDADLHGGLVVRQELGVAAPELLHGVAQWLGHTLIRARRLHDGLEVAQLRRALGHLAGLAALGFWERLEQVSEDEGGGHARQP